MDFVVIPRAQTWLIQYLLYRWLSRIASWFLGFLGDPIPEYASRTAFSLCESLPKLSSLPSGALTIECTTYVRGSSMFPSFALVLRLVWMME